MSHPRWAALLAVLAALLLAAAPAGPAAAEPAGPQLSVSGVQALPGKVRFYLAGRDLPAGAALSTQSLAVEAGGVPLPATVEPVGAGTAAPTPSRGVVLVVDASGSMAGAAVAAAREAALEYGAGLPPDVALGLVVFADTVTVAVAPTSTGPRSAPRWAASPPPAAPPSTTPSGRPPHCSAPGSTPTGGSWCSPTAPTPGRPASPPTPPAT
jgi:tight adherence protein B